MNHEPNTTVWKMGDLVIHDDDAKRNDMLMKVLNRIASGPNKGKFRTRYAYPHHQPTAWQRKVWINSIDKLHDPKRFGIDPAKIPMDRFSRDLDRSSRATDSTTSTTRSPTDRPRWPYRITGSVSALDDRHDFHMIYASIRKSSEYRHQTKAGEKFPVRIGRPGGYGDYVVEGNCNRYRIRDLRFYVRVGDRLICLEKKR